LQPGMWKESTPLRKMDGGQAALTAKAPRSGFSASPVIIYQNACLKTPVRRNRSPPLRYLHLIVIKR
jgi:hypothetical protein